MLLFGLIAFVSFSFVSCSNDDDNGPQDNPNSNLYGTWKSVEIFENGNLNENLSCTQTLQYNFSSNNTLTLTKFVGEDNNNCNELGTTNGVWAYKGNNNYLIYLAGDNVQDESQYTFHLSFNNGELKWRKNEGDSNFTRFSKQ